MSAIRSHQTLSKRNLPGRLFAGRSILVEISIFTTEYLIDFLRWQMYQMAG